MSEEYSVLVDGVEQDVDLDQIADFDSTEIEVCFGGFPTTPKCVAQWEFGVGEVTSLGGYIALRIPMVCKRCFAIDSAEFTTESFIGYEHEELIFVKDLKKDIGRLKGLLENSGFTGKGAPRKLLEEVAGTNMVAKITHSRNKNDVDKPFVNMDYKGVQTVEEFLAKFEG